MNVANDMASLARCSCHKDDADECQQGDSEGKKKLKRFFASLNLIVFSFSLSLEKKKSHKFKWSHELEYKFFALSLSDRCQCVDDIYFARWYTSQAICLHCIESSDEPFSLVDKKTICLCLVRIVSRWCFNWQMISGGLELHTKTKKQNFIIYASTQLPTVS